MPAVFSAYATIATILLSLEEFLAADAMLDSIMPQVLECEDVSLNARCFEVLGDAQVGIAGGERGEARSRRLRKAVDFVERAEREWERMGDRRGGRRCVGRKARIEEFVGERGGRDRAVERFRMLERQ